MKELNISLSYSCTWKVSFWFSFELEYRGLAGDFNGELSIRPPFFSIVSYVFCGLKVSGDSVPLSVSGKKFSSGMSDASLDDMSAITSLPVFLGLDFFRGDFL